MKGFRGTFIFTLIVLAVGIFTLQEFKKSKIEQEEKVTQDQIFRGFKVEEVASWEHSSKYTFKKNDSGWGILMPVADDADSETVESFFRSVFTQTVEPLDVDSDSGVEENKKKAASIENNKRYGFDSPLSTIEFNMVNGVKHKIIVGSVLTYDKGYYLKKDSDETIWVGTSSWEPLINKTYNDFRLKKIKFGGGDISRMQIKYKIEKNAGDLDFKKTGSRWEYRGNSKMLIDANEVAELFRKLKDLSADAIIEDRADTASIKKQNLDRANLVIGVTLADGDKTQEIRVSFYVPKTGDARYLSTSNTAIYGTTLTKAKEFIKSLDDFRDKTFLFNFDLNLLKKFAVKSNNIATYKFEKHPEGWSLQDAAGSNVGKRADQAEVTSFLTDLKGLKAESFYDKARKFKAQGEVVLQSDKGEILFSLLFGGLHKGLEGKELYVVKTNLSDEVVGVSKSTLDSLFAKKLTEDVPKPQPPAEQKK